MKRYLGELPPNTKLIVMFGLGTKLNYVKACHNIFQSIMGGDWRRLNAISYSDGRITVVHVEHFSSQGRLIPNWLGENDDKRAVYGQLAKSTIQDALDE